MLKEIKDLEDKNGIMPSCLITESEMPPEYIKRNKYKKTLIVINAASIRDLEKFMETYEKKVKLDLPFMSILMEQKDYLDYLNSICKKVKRDINKNIKSIKDLIDANTLK